MCRLYIRGQPAGAAAEPAPKLETPLDLDALFAEPPADDLGDMALLAMFSGTAQPAEAQEPAYQAGTISAGSSAGLPAEHHAGPVVVLGQALTAPAPQPAAAAFAAGLPPAVPANPVQQLQFQAVMQHRAAIMQNPAAYPVAAQAYQHAMLQQQHLLSAHAATYSGSLGVAPAPAAPLAGKRHKSQEEVEEQTERIKKRRRESAQRSRQRKSAYMKSLEMENRALKLENERLRMELNKGSGCGTATALPLPGSKASSGSVSRQPGNDSFAEVAGSEHVSVQEEEEEDEEEEAPLVHHMLAGADPLALMPTAELLSFAF